MAERERWRQKIKTKIENKEFYEAQQLVKTLNFRYQNSKQLDIQISLLFDGARILLENQRWNEGSELGNMLIEVYNQSKISLNEESIDRILVLSSFYPTDKLCGQETLLNNAIKWSVVSKDHQALNQINNQIIKNNNNSNNGNNTSSSGYEGEPQFHLLLAILNWNIEDFSKAQRHFLRSNEPTKFSQCLIDWALQLPYSERDLLIARAVFHYLCLSNLKDANLLFKCIFGNNNNNNNNNNNDNAKGENNDNDSNEREEETADGIPNTPIINFVRFLLLTLERDAYPLFLSLRNKYSPSLQRDSSFNHYLDHIAFVFFKQAKPASSSGMGGLFEGLFKSMMQPNQPNQQNQQLEYFEEEPEMVPEQEDVD